MWSRYLVAMRKRLLAALTAHTGPIPLVLILAGTVAVVFGMVSPYWWGHGLITLGTMLNLGSACFSWGWHRGSGHVWAHVHRNQLEAEAENLPHMIASASNDDEVPPGIVTAMQRRLREVQEELADV